MAAIISSVVNLVVAFCLPVFWLMAFWLVRSWLFMLLTVFSWRFKAFLGPDLLCVSLAPSAVNPVVPDPRSSAKICGE
jgi:hypothetical protein